jgi:hypothetical protein
MNAAVGCHLRGMQIAHRDAHFTGTYIKCSNVGTNDPAFCTLVDCVLGSSVGPGTVHLDLDKCIQFSAERCNFICGNPSVLGRAAHGYSNVIRFRDCQWAGNHTAPVRGGGQTWMFSGCTFEGLLSGAAGALVSADAAGAFNGLVIVGCWFGDASAGGTWIDIYCNGVHAGGKYIYANNGRDVDLLIALGAVLQLCANGGIRLRRRRAAFVVRGLSKLGNNPGSETLRRCPGSFVWAPNYGLDCPHGRAAGARATPPRPVADTPMGAAPSRRRMNQPQISDTFPISA